MFFHENSNARTSRPTESPSPFPALSNQEIPYVLLGFVIIYTMSRLQRYRNCIGEQRGLP